MTDISKIKKILVSQPQPDSAKNPYSDLAEKTGVHVEFRPFIQVEGITVKEFRQTRIQILDHSAVIFTSKTAIDHFFRICAEMRVTVPDNMKYFCISESTAFYLQKYIVFRKRKIFYGQSTFSAVIDLMKRHKDERYLVPLSHVHNPEIPELLDKGNFKYTKAIFYKTVSSDMSDIKELDYDILVFFSPSGIKSLLKNFPDFQQNDVRIAAFGHNTAAAVTEAGLRLDIEAPTSQTPSMTMALEQYIKTNNQKVE
ncbi:MAG: uroporphyrinogen-III synthase [Bacteroidales bacterium]|jgi:uroporphyrinogen-III synthase|nr:uroporphyrinogen-III synthase [Bacteroidales bacterium]